MRRASLYSRSPSAPSPEKPVEAPPRRKWRDLYTSYERQLLLGAAVLLGLLAVAGHLGVAPVPQAVSQEKPPGPKAHGSEPGRAQGRRRPKMPVPLPSWASA